MEDLANWMRETGNSYDFLAKTSGLSRRDILRAMGTKTSPEVAQKLSNATGIPAWKFMGAKNRA